MISNGLPMNIHRENLSPYFAPFLMGVWREACRHIEIGESTATISQILSERMPVQRCIVRRIDTARCSLETVAVSPASSAFAARTVCCKTQLQQVREWGQSGRVLQRNNGQSTDEAWDILVPPGIEGDVLAGPLAGPDGPCGVLLLVAEEGQVFEECHNSMVQALLEPFSAALENDHRLREMAVMQSAAEADKRSLLTRLGRKEMADTVVGADSGLRAVIERVTLVATSDVPVLVLGETGTGKELIARMIHTRSSRAGGPFLRINCGAIPLELIDSQLFGHERGAFTGALETRQGWFERADGGTLLLDEIGELPLEAQVRLLRILQDGWLERVGGQNPIHVDVRIVAATHRDLAAMVREGKFREDLWYRLAVFPIFLPPLRDRVGDIPELARHLAERAAARLVLPFSMPSPEDIQLLSAYPWPGNIRELAAVIDRAAILGNGKRLEVATALGVSGGRGDASPGGIPPMASRSNARTEIVSLAEANKRHIEAALAATRGRIEGQRGAAALLKINPHTLRARMRKLGVDWAHFREDSDVEDSIRP